MNLNDIFLLLFIIPFIIQIVFGFRVVKIKMPFKLISLINISDLLFIGWLNYFFNDFSLTCTLSNTELFSATLILTLLLMGLIGFQFMVNKRKSNL